MRPVLVVEHRELPSPAAGSNTLHLKVDTMDGKGGECQKEYDQWCVSSTPLMLKQSQTCRRPGRIV
ncbi:hypothetical protein TanjilG_32253 [Lupinus angustifolius]|uniref:Uncharacterized protein n=1 Tax=Lupinus angustifolius TaxID=3871 RepID=A0A4P1RFJ4_LUPAN|nr:hypothetical protein TanjilG_32253 [Lupinus angustifolius]